MFTFHSMLRDRLPEWTGLKWQQAKQNTLSLSALYEIQLTGNSVYHLLKKHFVYFLLVMSGLFGKQGKIGVDGPSALLPMSPGNVVETVWSLTSGGSVSSTTTAGGGCWPPSSMTMHSSSVGCNVDPWVMNCILKLNKNLLSYTTAYSFKILLFICSLYSQQSR